MKLIKEAAGVFLGTETHFRKGKRICTVRFIRHIGTGLLVDERVTDGSLPMDYHCYEFVLMGWPAGRSPAFGGGRGF